jgi:hypothetical protein
MVELMAAHDPLTGGIALHKGVADRRGPTARNTPALKLTTTVKRASSFVIICATCSSLLISERFWAFLLRRVRGGQVEMRCNVSIVFQE